MAGLSKSYGDFAALSDLNLKIEGSKCVGFLGPNGAGKTTTLKLLTDMIYPTAGEAFLDGVSVQKDRKRALARCGVLIESPEVYASLTPREALEMVGGLRGLTPSESSDRTSSVLEEVKMTEWADRKVGKFSKGMKQRINLAASLVHDPEILLLDEPSTGLDPRGMSEVRDIIRGLKRSQRLIFMSSHLLSEVTDVCDEVALINRGKLLFYDTLANVTQRFSSGQSSVDATFSRPVEPPQQSKLAAIPKVASVEWLEPNRARVHFPAGLENQQQLLEAIVGLRLGLTSFQESKSLLEDIYLRQIERGD
ncbi:MAG TPA: ABC transporter ATP-binding protein [Thermoplasmata archaeon]|nr:ABC transporter ATP-binding protein [Thermoplasmata archaeon]